MNTILVILGVLGLGAIVISAYVFIFSARKYVSNNHNGKPGTHAPPSRASLITRRPADRRSGKLVAFPLTVNSILVEQDRRHQPDRRQAA